MIVHLYRLYDSAASLLYIGITGDVKLRMSVHKSRSPWWHEVSDCRTESVDGWPEAAAAEAAAIRRERPRHNRSKGICHNIVEDLTTLIDSGAWPAGHQLPVDRELREIYGVSQMTIRTAVERLQADGRIISAAGKGRFVLGG